MGLKLAWTINFHSTKLPGYQYHPSIQVLADFKIFQATVDHETMEVDPPGHDISMKSKGERKWYF
jgi:hypothetical protein